MKRSLVRVGDVGVDANVRDKVLALVREDEVELILASSAANRRRPRVNGDDVADLYRLLREAGFLVRLAPSEDAALEHLCRKWQMGDETMVLEVDGNSVKSSLSKANPLGWLLPQLPASRRVWIGMGSNTWRSELELDIAYVRTAGPANAPGATLDIPWMAGIPGTIGGWIKMNAGAFGHSISEVLEAVCIDGEWRAASACGFAYRHSDIKGEIQDFRLRKDWQRPIESAADFLCRRRKFPAGTFGSFFKNPEGDFVGRILEVAGAKSLRVGGAYIWSEHANVMVAGPGAVPSDVLALARLMMAAAYRTCGRWLEPEVCGLFD